MSGQQFQHRQKYTGTGAEQEIKQGFQPKTVKIWSAGGSAETGDHMGGKIFKRVVAGDMTVLTAGLEITEFGVKITGSDAVLNQNGVEYYIEMNS